MRKKEGGKGHKTILLQCMFTDSEIPYSGKFSPGKIIAKANSVVLRKNFARSIFAHT